MGATCVANIAQNSDLQISKVGCPIRKFTDQCLFAAPHDLSQRTTSFIASQRQGIHRIPLRHLIALIIDAHRSAAKGLRSVLEGKPKGSIIKDQFASNTPEDVAVMLRPLTEPLARRNERRSNRMYFLFTMAENPRSVLKGKTHARESKTCFRTIPRNSQGLQKAWRPPSGGARRDRTDDLVLAKHALSQLSYGPLSGR
jgi:hypothetical protein